MISMSSMSCLVDEIDVDLGAQRVVAVPDLDPLSPRRANEHDGSISAHPKIGAGDESRLAGLDGLDQVLAEAAFAALLVFRAPG
ncbi:hypothetical protein CPT_Seuss85 [Caulobacter phage Seuss]|uniref:Uncharacterized protein n=1 Tax=Caulobacter phage Seuss TaxID=1675601 RepID=A0A0K1LM81_9CAUD|nr:hypothetical protein HOR08_gp085 [Caulobacter phage Seuss]AKU43611.1 hypothetical protein CPT_Seuss85 [Caulobacter phage Seuss]